ncbi:hypothetical protein MSG28_011039 [Choristoneura fumiferana]|uniref:Uncharacterized protein n=2 Tax=Choristoneura fumiferana TaxID=7141 RepID=A0ACC0KPZ3_CHOFU|nr:hypothetical protein MSG28_011039 [Choristoneura fumiferana]
MLAKEIEEETNEIEDEYSMYEDLEESVEEVYRAPLFDGRARMTARTRLPAKRFDIWAEVSAVCGQGTLLSAAGTRDHLWLGFGENKSILRWNAGSGPMELRSGRVRTDGRSKISARRYKKDAMLRLGSSTVRGSGPGRMSSLDVDPFIYVGHPPANVTKRLFGAPMLAGFVGCVHRLRVSGRDVIPPARGLHVTAHGLRPCTPRNLAQLVCP